MKGILMKPEMIVATVEGRKTNTRRAEAGLKEINREPSEWIYKGWSDIRGGFVFQNKFSDYFRIAKPRYHTGEVVYIKEAGVWDNKTKFRAYKSNFTAVPLHDTKWQSPLFMPEWAARHFIKILDVRAERLQEITSYDIEREGLPYKIERGDEAKENYDSEVALEWFRNIWNSINKDYPWESNPWVFRYEFEYLKEGR